jgi:hypothetical protein
VKVFFIAQVLFGGCCKGEEIASVLDVNYITLERACKPASLQACKPASVKKNALLRTISHKRSWESKQAYDATRGSWLKKRQCNNANLVRKELFRAKRQDR